MNNKLISKTLLAGLALAVAAVGLFLVLWFALGNLEPFLRLFLSVCVPPALIAAVLGVYILSTRHRAPSAMPRVPTDDTQP